MEILLIVFWCGLIVKADDYIESLVIPIQNNNCGDFHHINAAGKSVKTVLLLNLGFDPKIVAKFNSYEHLPINPYVALLLSHYGKYSPIYGKGRGLYSYLAANNYHNNKPFGPYKIYEDNDS